MIKKAIYILLILTIFFTPISVFMRSVCFYLAVLLLIILPLKLYWKQISYVDVFFVFLFLIYIIQLVKFKDYRNWFKSFSGSFMIHLLLFQMFNLVYRNLKDKVCKKKFVNLILGMILVSAILSSFYVLYQYPIIKSPIVELSKAVQTGKYRMNGYFINTGAWKLSTMGDKSTYATGKWGHWNIYSSHLVLALLICLYFLGLQSPDSIKSKWIKLGLISSIPLIIFNIYLTFSRGALLISFPIVFFTLLITQYRKMKFYILGIVIIMIILISYIFFNGDAALRATFKNRISQVKAIDMKISTERDEIFLIAIKSIRKIPFWGIGPGKVKQMYLDFYHSEIGSKKSTHNLFLQVWLELGFSGFIIYLFFLATFIWKNVKMIYKIPNCPDKYFLGIISFIWLFAQIIRNLWDYMFIDSGYGFLFWTMIFINLVTLQKEQREEFTTESTEEKVNNRERNTKK